MQLPLRLTTGQQKPAGIPKINWDHPLTRGLLLYAFDTGAKVLDLARARPTNGVTGATLAGRSISSFGDGVLYNGSDGRAFVDDAAIQSASAAPPWTYACGYVNTGTLSASSRSFGRTASNGGANPSANWDFEHAAGADQSRVDYTINNNGANQTLTVTGVNAQNTFTTLAGVATSATAFAGYHGKGSAGIVQGGTLAPTAIASVNTNANVLISGGSTAAAANAFVGFVFYGAFWTRALSTPELNQLHFDPYCFLTFEQDLIWSTLVGRASIKFRRTLSAVGARAGARQRAA